MSKKDKKNKCAGPAGDNPPVEATEPAPIDEKANITNKMSKLPKWRFWAIGAIAILYLLFQIYVKLIYAPDGWIQVPMHLYIGLILAFLFKPLAETYKKKWLWGFDILLMAASLVCLVYFVTHIEYLNYYILSVTYMTFMDLFVAFATLVVLLEAVRRMLGKTLFFVILFFIAYAFFGQIIPGTFQFAGMTLRQFAETMTMGLNGIFGTPLSISASTIFYFMVFGAVFATTGGGQVLIDLGLKTSTKSTGGPAKAAVISSGLMGMISGSAIANVTTTGVLTIPLMKRTGYSPEEAGAIESVASTGGQLMPPIMGAGAFIMAELLGVQYAEVATRAIIPALAYYFAAFSIVHLLAKKRKLKKIDTEVIKTPRILPRLYRLLPVILVITMIFMGYSLPRSALYGTGLALVMGAISKDTRMNLKQLLSVLMDGTRQAVSIAIPTAACGIMIGIVARSGVAVKIAKLIALSGNNSLLVALLIAAAGCILLGMALPTVAAYLIANVLFVSSIYKILIAMGMATGMAAFVANMFIFYFGVIAQITPPVCLASFTAAGIAGGKSWATGWKAFAFASVAFMVPFVFAYDPAILLYGTVPEIIYAAAVVGIGAYFLATALAGYQFGVIPMFERIIIACAALMMIVPESFTDYIGFGIGAAFFAFNLVKHLRKKKQLNVAT